MYFFFGGGGDNRGLSLKQWFKRGRVGGGGAYRVLLLSDVSINQKSYYFGCAMMMISCHLGFKYNQLSK